ncbi:MAG: hypothetical protein OEU92_21865 [Alphaproteobacteria bacterium]|nr:hypothetical protein [Alphaproteobacteria bacterium]
MNAIEAAAFISIGRASGFAGLAILCVMLGLSFEPVLATRAGGLMSLGLAAVLTMFGAFARGRAYQKTETWLILPEDARPPTSIAQQIIGKTLRDTYFWFAERVFIGAMVLLAASWILRLMGLPG